MKLPNAKLCLMYCPLCVKESHVEITASSMNALSLRCKDTLYEHYTTSVTTYKQQEEGVSLTYTSETLAVILAAESRGFPQIPKQCGTRQNRGDHHIWHAYGWELGIHLKYL